MKKQYLIVIITFILILFTISFYSQSQIQNVCYQNHCFDVEIADTIEERRQGLMFKQLNENEGMLFIFDKPGIYPFWMKNTLISLDMIWINETYHIVHIEKNVPSCNLEICPSYNPNKTALYVLEINSGTSDEIKLKIGDKLNFN